MAEFSGLQHAAPEQEEERRQHQRAAAKVASILAVSAAVGIAAFATVGVITEFATKQKKEKLLETMSHATQEQALHMENRIESSEQALFAFSEKPEITALLKNTDQPDLTETVQLLTEEYSRSIADAEGLGICDNNTRFLAHTNKMVVGMQTRAEANRLEQFHDALLDAGDQVLDCGIILSPTQHEPVLSLYKAIKDENGNLLGNTSLGVYAKSFIENPSPALEGAEDASYTLVSAETAKYLLHSDETLVGGDVQNDRLLDLCSVLSTGNGDLTGSFEYTADHKTHLASYQYMPEYGCILLLDATV